MNKYSNIRVEDRYSRVRAMTVTLEWYDTNERILLYTFDGKWMWQELEPLFQRAKAMALGVQHDYLVHVIVDLRNASMHIPKGVLKHMKIITEQQAPNAGVTVLVTTDSGMHVLHKTVTQVFRAAYPPVARKFEHHFHMSRTMDEALSTIHTLMEAEMRDPKTETD